MAGQNDFYKRMRGRVTGWSRARSQRMGEWTEYALVAPDIFHLLCRLVLDKEVPAREKARLGLAIAYFVSPVDLLPEALLGPGGYADDVVLAAYVLQGMLANTPEHVIQRHWAGEGDVLEVVQHALNVAQEWLSPRFMKKFRRLFGEERPLPPALSR
ncbi:MAG: DUF1232 domain-containing protein [Perlucidibaca sp.]